MDTQSFIKNLCDSLASLSKNAQTAEDYIALAEQAKNIAFLSEAIAGSLAKEKGCTHPSYKHSVSGWGEIECKVCGKSGILRDKTPDFS